MAAPAQRQATYQDLLKVAPELVAEILAGRLVSHPRPGPKHAVAGSVLGGALVGPFQSGHGGPGGWWILDEPELHLDADVLVPDIAGWRRERMPHLPETAWFETVPDWICEILSASTARDDRVVKMPIYARAGVAYLWLLDPDLRTLEVFGLESGRWVLLETHRDEARITPPPFEALAIALGDLWA